MIELKGILTSDFAFQQRTPEQTRLNDYFMVWIQYTSIEMDSYINFMVWIQYTSGEISLYVSIKKVDIQNTLMNVIFSICFFKWMNIIFFWHKAANLVLKSFEWLKTLATLD